MAIFYNKSKSYHDTSFPSDNAVLLLEKAQEDVHKQSTKIRHGSFIIFFLSEWLIAIFCLNDGFTRV